MAQITFAGTAGGTTAQLDANFSELYGFSKNLVSDASGNVGVGVEPAFLNGRLQIGNLTNAGTEQVTRFRLGSNNNNGASYHLICNTGGTDRLYVYGNGNVVNTSNSYGSLSDAKLKTHITDATPKLDGLMRVRVVSYRLKSDPEAKYLGVVAQELEQVFPGLVEASPDRAEDGTDLGTVTKSVKYSVFVPMLVKALQEQQALISGLTARVAALEA
jgi:Chaperone of endosialidase